jgi:hypothetical protein
MVRHEIMNLELAPVQFYPNCAHLEVVGDGVGVPEEEFLVRFPGAYAMSGKWFFLFSFRCGCVEEVC